VNPFLQPTLLSGVICLFLENSFGTCFGLSVCMDLIRQYKSKLVFFSALVATISGCEHLGSDLTAPSTPQGLSTQPGDNYVELFWNNNPEPDLAGYNVYVGTVPEGRFDLIGTVGMAYFHDTGATNGLGYYYAVTAFDHSGNESALTPSLAYEVPRPDGVGAVLHDSWRFPESSAFDLSSASVIPFDDLYSDMYFENVAGIPYMVVRYDDTDIQDAGFTTSLMEVGAAPTSGWSPTHDVQLVEGHTYIVWTWDDHYAKFRVTDISPDHLIFDWAYQLQASNTMLKQAGARPRERAARVVRER
jgi:hypothetical protein